MMGFGSDSYHQGGGGYTGGGSTPYDPPGGGGYGINTANGGGGDKNWGTTTSINEYKSMGNTYEKKSSTASGGVPIV